jgi:hypothetical protein
MTTTEPKPSIKSEMFESYATSSTESAECSTPEPGRLRTDSKFLLDEFNSSKDKRFNEQPPRLEPVTETNSDPEEIVLLRMELDARRFNDHQKKKFKRLRKRVWELETKLCDAKYQLFATSTNTEGNFQFIRETQKKVCYHDNRLRLHEQCFYLVGIMWMISMGFIFYKISTISS